MHVVIPFSRKQLLGHLAILHAIFVIYFSLEVSTPPTKFILIIVLIRGVAPCSAATEKMDGKKTFKYTRLEDTSVHIRLLKIMPAEPSSPIRCMLDVANLKHEYTCLSYCWGPEKPARPILVNDRVLVIRSNLYDFLLTARSQGITDWIWTDAICIDQSNYGEKASQVQMMGTIYAQAMETIVWCGLSVRDMSHLHQLAHFVAVHWKSPIPSVRADTQDLLQLESEDIARRFDSIFQEVQHHVWDVKSKPWYSSSYRTAQRFFENRKEVWCLLIKNLSLVSSFVTLEYWQRTWVVQELVLSRKPVLLASGEFLPADSLLNLVSMFREFLEIRNKLRVAKSAGVLEIDLKIEDYITHSRRLFTLRPEVGRPSSAHFSPLSLHRVFQLTHETHCQDVRDHAFSLLFLIEESQRFFVDYNKSRDQVFYDATSAYVRDIFRSSTWPKKREWLNLFAEMLYKDLEISAPVSEIGTLATIWEQADTSTDAQDSPFWADSLPAYTTRGKKILQSDRPWNRDLCFLIELDTADWVVVAFQMSLPKIQWFSPFDANSPRAWRQLSGIWQSLEDTKIP